MTNTGIERKVDELGRIVLPIEVRKTLNIDERDSLIISIDGKKIVLEKSVQNCIICSSNDGTIQFRDKILCASCIKELHSQYNGKDIAS